MEETQPHTMPRWPLWAVLGLVVLASLIVTSVNYLIHTSVDPIIENQLATQDKFLPRYIEDTERVLGLPLSEKSKFTADAGPLLNSALPWLPEQNNEIVGTATATLTKKISPLVTKKEREQILRYGGNWLEHLSRHNRVSHDFSILEKLNQFDYWNLEENSPLESLIRNKTFVDATQLPAPDPQDLVTLIKLKVMKSVDGGDPIAILRNIRHIAQLFFTTENLQLFVTGLKLLDVERKAYHFFVDEEILNEPDWTPIASSQIQTAFKVATATKGYLYLWTKPETIEKVFLNPQEPPIAFCAATNEGLPHVYSLRSALYSQWPHERKNKIYFETLDRVYQRAAAVCRIKYLRTLKEIDGFEPPLERGLNRMLLKTPYYRMLLGLKMSTLTFSGFDAYVTSEKLSAESSDQH